MSSSVTHDGGLQCFGVIQGLISELLFFNRQDSKEKISVTDKGVL